MPQYTVQLLAFGKDNEVRTVEVPDDEKTDNNENLLELIFKYGQNDFQPQRHPSVSAGDVIEIPDSAGRGYYLVMTFGFKRLSLVELRGYQEIDRLDRHFAPVRIMN